MISGVWYLMIGDDICYDGEVEVFEGLIFLFIS